MTVLLTGGSGFLGSHVAEHLSRDGRQVRALVRETSDTGFLKTLENVELVTGSVEDRESLVRAARGVDAIIHAAGLVKARNEDEFRQTNVVGTQNAVEAAKRNGVKRFVYVSSQSVAGPSAGGQPVSENLPPNPVTRYGRSKLEGERVVLAAKDEVAVVIIRPPLIYGPRDREVLAFFKAVKFGVLAIMGSAENRISVVYGADCAAACIRAVDADVPSGSIYYVEDGRTRTFGELVLGVEQAVGSRAWLRFALPRPLVESVAFWTELYGRASNRAVILTRDKCNELFGQWVCDATKARRELGWEPQVPFEKGAKLAADWYRTAKWL